MSEQELSLLKHKRGILRSQLTKFKNYLVDYRSKRGLQSIQQLKLRLEKVENTWDSFNEIQTQIELLETEGEHEIDRELYEEQFYDLVATAKDIITQSNVENSNESTSNQANFSNNSQGLNSFKFANIKLPTIDLCKFDGKYEMWLNFYESFKSIIHENATLSNVHKFHYLRSSLEGEAAETIQSLEISSDNYMVAWTLLKERYDNKRVIVQTHVRALFELPCITKDSHTSLRHFIDNVNKHIRALKALDEPTEYWDTLLIYLVTAKLDKKTHTEWEESLTREIVPTWQKLDEFLQKKCKVLEAIGADSKSKSSTLGTSRAHFSQVLETTGVNSKSKSSILGTNRAHFSNTQAKPPSRSCVMCKQIHFLNQCPKFLAMTIDQRSKKVKDWNLCYNCLRGNHISRNCNSGKCRKCAKNHNTLLHKAIYQEDDSNATSTDNEVTNSSEGANAGMESAQAQIKSTNTHSINKGTAPFEVLLATAIIDIYDKDGKRQACRVLLDSGAQSNFITSKLAKQLGLKQIQVNVPVQGISETETPINAAVRADIASRYKDYRTTLTFLLLPKITGLIPSQSLDVKGMKIPPRIQLADPTFCTPSEVDMLIGNEIFFEILLNDRIQPLRNFPILQHTLFGWILSGRLYNSSANVHVTKCNLATADLSSQISKFWELEHCPEKQIFSEEEMACEAHYVENTHRDAVGRYIVRLPFKKDMPQLGETYDIAVKRLIQLERRLKSDENLKKQYCEFLEDYRQLGHMEECHEDITAQPNYYLPHHPVVKESSITTKVRVVFDASTLSTTGVSLNDTLMIGAKIQDDLIAILMRFRIHTFVLTADIAKMYRQVQIHEDDRKFQRILWRTDPSQQITVYELKTVTYGTASAPWLATRTLHQLAKDEENNFPMAASILRRDFYVDDLLTGANTIEEAKVLRDELMKLLHKGGFHLRKWTSNSKELIEPFHDGNDQLLCLNTDNSVKVLGVHWDSKQDSILYSVSLKGENVVTKRSILAQIASLYDPLGILGPIIIIAKLTMQQLWLLKSEWDDEVPSEMQGDWKQYTSELIYLEELRIPRKITLSGYKGLYLHGFSDASEKAYGACCYLQSLNENGVRETYLVAAKSRVAPLKTVSLPRLELCAAVLLVKLCKIIVEALHVKMNNIYLWSDSEIVLCWINTSPHVLKTFVANRITEIQQSTNSEQWSHVASIDNPADIISRGCRPKELVKCKLWWEGPPWINEDKDKWPKWKTHTVKVPELKPTTTVVAVNTQNDFELINKFSSLTRLQRVVAYCLRFITALKQKTPIGGPLSMDELSKSLSVIIKIAQREGFSSEIHVLNKGEHVSKQSSLSSLNPFIDKEGILRVGGRLKNAKIPYHEKYPILISRGHYLGTLIIKYEHVRNYHAGVQATMYLIRRNYWLLNARNHVRRYIHTCLVCFKMKPKIVESLMGNLPEERAKYTKAFTHTGVDLCGPFWIKEKRVRNRGKVKVYVAVFVCFCTRAVHLELVSDLSTPTFLGALKRFFARRGKANHMYSDNATNFQGGANELKRFFDMFTAQNKENEISVFLAEYKIEWHFIPPRAPNFGGLWEAAVKSFKYHFVRVIGDHLFSYEDLSTFICEIEAILNSRPISPLSCDPNDFLPLTPGHFLIGDSLRTIAEPEVGEIPTNRLKIWQTLTHMKQNFWKRWQMEYLNSMQQRHKWRSSAERLKLGMLVIIKEINTPPGAWILGRIVELHPGDDGEVRVVTVKTAQGVKRRSVRQLCLLPTDGVEANASRGAVCSVQQATITNSGGGSVAMRGDQEENQSEVCLEACNN